MAPDVRHPAPMTLGNTAAVRVRLHRVIARLASIRSSPTPPRWLLGAAPSFYLIAVTVHSDIM